MTAQPPHLTDESDDDSYTPTIVIPSTHSSGSSVKILCHSSTGWPSLDSVSSSPPHEVIVISDSSTASSQSRPSLVTHPLSQRAVGLPSTTNGLKQDPKCPCFNEHKTPRRVSDAVRKLVLDMSKNDISANRGIVKQILPPTSGKCVNAGLCIFCI